MYVELSKLDLRSAEKAHWPIPALSGGDHTFTLAQARTLKSPLWLRYSLVEEAQFRLSSRLPFEHLSAHSRDVRVTLWVVALEADLYQV